MLSKKLPFEGETSFDFLMARLTEPPRPLKDVNPDAPPVFVPILDKALAQDPDQRYQTMDEFSNALVAARRKLRRAQFEPTSIIKTEQLQDTMAFLKLSDTGHEIKPNNKAELIVGRAYRNSKPDIDLGPHGGTQAGVSRKHGRFVRQDDEWFVEDLGSTNGTFVDGKKIPANKLIPVQKGTSVRFGQIEMEFRLEE